MKRQKKTTPTKNFTVEAFNTKQMKRIQKMLIDRGEHRNALLFTLGCSNGLRAGDLLKVTVGMIRDCQIGEKILITEDKTNKGNFFVFNKTAHKLLKKYMETRPNAKDDELLFESQRYNKDGIKKMDTRSVNALIQRWARDCRIQGHFGSHSMRKSFGRFQRKNGTPIEMLMHRFNHSTVRQTLTYLGITAEETKNMLLVDPFNG